MSVRISLPQDDTPEELFTRTRLLAGQRSLYEWERLPGLPPLCKGVPAPERFAKSTTHEMLSDAMTSVLSGGFSLFGWLRGKPPSCATTTRCTPFDDRRG